MIPAAYNLSALSPLGTFGLGLTGGYGSYDTYMPYSMMGGYGLTPGLGAGLGMGMDSSIFSLGGYGLGLGGYGYMNSMLQYPLLYNQVQEQIENNQLNHAIEMQEGMNRYGVAAHKSSDRALFEKVANNGQVQYGIDNLYRKVMEGDQDGIKKQFNDVRNYILQTYNKELSNLGDEINPIATANEYVKRIYSSVVSESTGRPADLENDIVRYGDGAAMNGFLQGFRPGHHQSYVDETLQYCFGRDIDHQEYKDHMQGIAKGAGRAAQVVEKGAIGAGVGAVAGATLYAGGKGIKAVLSKTFSKTAAKGVKGKTTKAASKAAKAARQTFIKNTGKAGVIGALIAGTAALAGDIIWQISDGKSAA